MKLVCRPLPTLPRLAWVATVSPDAQEVEVVHGRGVECGASWVVEGVWDAEFSAGDFHRSDHFFGSGLRVDGDRLWFIPSCALVDRLLTCEWRERRLVSNSLSLLLAFTGARPDPDHDYRAESFAIRQGIRRYPRSLPVRHRAIKEFTQIYYERLLLESGTARFLVPDLAAEPPFSCYEDYRDRLLATLRALRDNYTSPARRTPLTPCVTVSSGFDSTAVAALVRTLGVTTAFTCRRSNTHTPRWFGPNASNDDGTPIARALGLSTVVVDPDGPHAGNQELFFLAGTAGPHSLPFLPMTRYLTQRCPGAVLFTGFQGDYVWDAHCDPRYLNDEMTGNDTSGLGLAEIRLQTGFIHIPVPFLFARRIRELVAISNSRDMELWRSGDPTYDRPIPRRLAEHAWVPRRLFGKRKKAVVQTTTFPADPLLRRAFFTWLRARSGRGASFVYAWTVLNRAAFLIVRSGHRLWRACGGTPPPTPQVFFWKNVDLPSLLHTWSVTVLSACLAMRLWRTGPVPSNTVTHADPLHAGL